MNSLLKTRMNRATYWAIFVPVVVLYGLALAFLPKPPGIGEIILVSLGVPRLHDLGRSGWWIAAPIVLEFLALGASLAFLPFDDIMIVAGLVVMGMVAVMVVLGTIPGQPVANKFGEPTPPGVKFLSRAKTA